MQRRRNKLLVLDLPRVHSMPRLLTAVTHCCCQCSWRTTFSGDITPNRNEAMGPVKEALTTGAKLKVGIHIPMCHGYSRHTKNIYTELLHWRSTGLGLLGGRVQAGRLVISCCMSYYWQTVAKEITQDHEDLHLHQLWSYQWHTIKRIVRCKLPESQSSNKRYRAITWIHNTWQHHISWPWIDTTLSDNSAWLIFITHS